MSPGKIAAQTGHAFLDTALLAQATQPDKFRSYKTNHGIKIVMGASHLRYLLKAYEMCQEAGIPAVLITDLGYFGTKEELLGKEVITALGIGPAKRDELKKITKLFQILT
jgi:peptidyl-tRNA hydrolase